VACRHPLPHGCLTPAAADPYASGVACRCTQHLLWHVLPHERQSQLGCQQLRKQQKLRRALGIHMPLLPMFLQPLAMTAMPPRACLSRGQHSLPLARQALITRGLQHAPGAASLSKERSHRAAHSTSLCCGILCHTQGSHKLGTCSCTSGGHRPDCCPLDSICHGSRCCCSRLPSQRCHPELLPVAGRRACCGHY